MWQSHAPFEDPNPTWNQQCNLQCCGNQGLRKLIMVASQVDHWCNHPQTTSCPTTQSSLCPHRPWDQEELMVASLTKNFQTRHLRLNAPLIHLLCGQCNMRLHKTCHTQHPLILWAMIVQQVIPPRILICHVNAHGLSWELVARGTIIKMLHHEVTRTIDSIIA